MGTTTNGLTEEQAYAKANDELEGGAENKVLGLWAMAYADAMGDEKGQKALYLKYRAEQLIGSVKVTESPSEIAPETEPEEVPKPPVDELTAGYMASQETVSDKGCKTSQSAMKALFIIVVALSTIAFLDSFL